VSAAEKKHQQSAFSLCKPNRAAKPASGCSAQSNGWSLSCIAMCALAGWRLLAHTLRAPAD